VNVKHQKSYQSDKYFDYLKELDTIVTKKCSEISFGHFLSLDNVEEALKVNSSVKVKDVLTKKLKSKAHKKDFTNSLYALDLVNMAQTHFRFIVFQHFKFKMTSGYVKCQQLRKHLTNLCLLYGLTMLQNDMLSCYECGYFRG
jgi:hypothetical protein